MALPFKFRFIRRDTGETFKQWAIREKKTKSAVSYSKKFGLMPFINGDGNIGIVDFEDFYTVYEFLSPKDWKVFVATEKDEKGNWLYKQIGY